MSNPGTSGEVKFKTTMKILKKDDGGPVFFKFDGERFQTAETIKFQSGVQYRVILEFKPDMELRYNPFFIFWKYIIHFYLQHVKKFDGSFLQQSQFLQAAYPSTQLRKA